MFELTCHIEITIRCKIQSHGLVELTFPCNVITYKVNGPTKCVANYDYNYCCCGRENSHAKENNEQKGQTTRTPHVVISSPPFTTMIMCVIKI